MKHELMTVTPAMAADWLRLNTHNRTLRHKISQMIADDIKAGRWVPEESATAPIAFYTDGQLANGQHRLSAIVIAQIPVKSWVLRGVPLDVEFDNVRARSVVDNLSMNHVSSAALVAATARDIVLYAKRLSVHQSVSKREMMTAVDVFDIEKQAAPVACMKTPFRKSAFASLRILGGMQDEAKMEAFTEGYAHGVGLDATSPALVLRNRIASEVGSGTYRKAYLFNLMAWAWNAYTQGREMQIIRIPKGAETQMIDVYGVPREMIAGMLGIK